ncbi:hypothetical protein LAZ29_02160 [Cereibacter sphaeroides]|nr:hypothetical protein [Cereibacter sphaeroides]
MAMGAIMLYFLPRLLGEFCTLNPGIEVTLTVTNRNTVIARLAAQEGDLCTLGQPAEGPDGGHARCSQSDPVAVTWLHPWRKSAACRLPRWRASCARRDRRTAGRGTVLCRPRHPVMRLDGAGLAPGNQGSGGGRDRGLQFCRRLRWRSRRPCAGWWRWMCRAFLLMLVWTWLVSAASTVGGGRGLSAHLTQAAPSQITSHR